MASGRTHRVRAVRVCLGAFLVAALPGPAPAASPGTLNPPLALSAPVPTDRLDLRLSSPALEDLEVYGEFPVSNWNSVDTEAHLVEELTPPPEPAEPEPDASEESHGPSEMIDFPAGLTGSTFHFGPGLHVSPSGTGADPAGRGFRLPGPALGFAPMALPGAGNLALDPGYEDNASTPVDGAGARVWSGVMFNF